MASAPEKQNASSGFGSIEGVELQTQNKHHLIVVNARSYIKLSGNSEKWL
jgi:hypothetical protein